MVPIPRGWRLLTDVRLPRLSTRIDAVLLAENAVLVLGAERAATEAAAVDLADFHAGCRGVPVLPVVLMQGERVVLQRPLPLAGAAPPTLCTRLLLPLLFDHVARFPAVPGFDPAGWEAAPYRPVPGLMQAACELYARHDVGRMRLASAERGDLQRTRAAVEAALSAGGPLVVVFVTGAPGAGKTLCGLDLAFSPGRGAAFLTGNPALLMVLREALVRDAVGRAVAARAARQRVEAVVQPLHAFRDHHLAHDAAPPDRMLVIDEAQRCWTAAHAERKTRNRMHRVPDSEPGVVLDAMARRADGAAIVCLIGGGQEIHAGEGGLAAWGAALAARPSWRVVAPPCVLTAADPRQRLPALPGLRTEADLHLRGAVRAHRMPSLVDWVDAVLDDAPGRARRVAEAGVAVGLTRSLPGVPAAVRGRAGQRWGVVASSGARRLRAEGLAAMLWHQDKDAVASWFLDAWPDVRSADAMEVAATEFGVQGLELDNVGVCWDLDLVRAPDERGWQARAFRGSAWTVPRNGEVLANRLNAYRVLLTRARRSMTIWVPRGDARDRTRDPDLYDGVAAYLLACGAQPCEADRAPGQAARERNKG